MSSSRSAALYERAQKVLPGGVSRNTVLRDPHPLYAAHGEGCRVTDIEGVERIDFANNMASLIHGHAHPEVMGAVAEQLQRGTAFTFATEVEIEFAEEICSRSPSFEKLRFVNSGTEAVMSGIKAARAFTSRPKIAKCEGAYHGTYDYAEVSQIAKPHNWGEIDRPRSVPVVHGTPAAALGDVVIIPYNDIERSLAILDDHKNDLACLLLDLMSHRVGLTPAEPEYIQALQNWARANGALILLDEVVTFRSEFGGAQAWYPELEADLTALGKTIGGGFPVGALAGRGDIMDVMNPRRKELLFPHSGTFSANPVTMTAGLTTMRLYDAEAVARVNTLARRAMDGITAAIGASGVHACVTGGGSMFRVHLKETPPRTYREAYSPPEELERLKVLLDHLFASGLMMINTCSATISTVMSEVEIDVLVQAMHTGFQKLAALPDRG